jgi:hypothetical protein
LCLILVSCKFKLIEIPGSWSMVSTLWVLINWYKKNDRQLCIQTYEVFPKYTD